MAEIQHVPEPLWLKAEWTESRLGMSNCFHQIDEGFAEALASGKVFGRHSAWDFNGIVWQGDDGRYYEAVYCYHVYCGVYGAATLKDLMHDVNEVFGWA